MKNHSKEGYFQKNTSLMVKLIDKALMSWFCYRITEEKLKNWKLFDPKVVGVIFWEYWIIAFIRSEQFNLLFKLDLKS